MSAARAAFPRRRRAPRLPVGCRRSIEVLPGLFTMRWAALRRSQLRRAALKAVSLRKSRPTTTSLQEGSGPRGVGGAWQGSVLRLGPVAPAVHMHFPPGAPAQASQGRPSRKLRGGSVLAKILLYPRHWWRRLPSNSMPVRHARRPPQRRPVRAVLHRQNAGRDASG